MIDPWAYTLAERQRDEQRRADHQAAAAHHQAPARAPAYSLRPSAIESRAASLDREFAALHAARTARQTGEAA